VSPAWLFRHVARGNALDVVDVQLLVEALLDGRRVTGDPDLQARIEVDVAGDLDAEVGDAPVGQRTVLDLFARQALLVYQDQALVREDEEVPDQLVGLLDRSPPASTLAKSPSILAGSISDAFPINPSSSPTLPPIWWS
jgi:hypothetical protein